MKTTKAKTAPRDVCAEVTAKMVEALEKGVAPWVKPWSGNGGVPSVHGMPHNAVTGKPYHGANVLVLWCTDFTDQRWVTFQQANTLGGSVRRGEKGQTVCWWSKVTKKTEGATEGEEDTTSVHMVCRAYTVFNVAQCDGLTLDTTPPGVTHSGTSFIGDETAARVGAKVLVGGDKAFYSPSSDVIGMPTPAAFKDEENYDATMLHELTHWTGHLTRLDRDFSKTKRFGSDAYAFEELVAEIGSAFACAHLGVEGKLQHAEYLNHWLKILKADRHAIFTAAREAEKAFAMLVPMETKLPSQEG